MEYIEEVESKEEANKFIKEKSYRLERFSESRNCYILVQRKK